ncbi:MAG: hypothetical protein WC858_00070 [Parcubacteria group bacterium]|jgi:hypothetical protein
MAEANREIMELLGTLAIAIGPIVDEENLKVEYYNVQDSSLKNEPSYFLASRRSAEPTLPLFSPENYILRFPDPAREGRLLASKSVPVRLINIPKLAFWVEAALKAMKAIYAKEGLIVDFKIEYFEPPTC